MTEMMLAYQTRHWLVSEWVTPEEINFVSGDFPRKNAYMRSESCAAGLLSLMGSLKISVSFKFGKEMITEM